MARSIKGPSIAVNGCMSENTFLLKIYLFAYATKDSLNFCNFSLFRTQKFRLFQEIYIFELVANLDVKRIIG